MRDIFAFLVVCIASIASADPTGAILTTGVFHGEEVNVEDGQKWLALFESNGAYELKPVTVRVKMVADDVGGDELGETTGKEVTIEGGGPEQGVPSARGEDGDEDDVLHAGSA